MDSLNQIELQNIRHIYGTNKGACTKIEYYKTLIQDQNLTQILDEICKSATTLNNKFKNFVEEACHE